MRTPIAGLSGSGSLEEDREEDDDDMEDEDEAGSVWSSSFAMTPIDVACAEEMCGSYLPGRETGMELWKEEWNCVTVNPS